MKKVNVLIVEDEPIIADDLALMMEDLGHQVVGLSDTCEEGLQLIERFRPDIALLDIMIRGNDDGIRLAHQINERYQTPFVFISSLYDTHTLNRARNTHPCGYLVKPFKESDLKVTIELALGKISPRPKPENTAPLHLFVRQSNGMVPLDVAVVTYVEASDSYSILYTEAGRHTVTHTLKEIEEALSGQGFCRIHKSYMVNFRKIDRIEQSVVMIQEKMLPIGKSYRKSFFDRLTVF